MSRHKSSSIVCIINIYRISIKTLLCALYTIGRRIYKSTYCPFPFILQRKASLIFFSFSDCKYFASVSINCSNFICILSVCIIYDYRLFYQKPSSSAFNRFNKYHLRFFINIRMNKFHPLWLQSVPDKRIYNIYQPERSVNHIKSSVRF